MQANVAKTYRRLRIRSVNGKQKKEWPYAKIVYEKEGWDDQRSMRKNVQANVSETYRRSRIRSINGKKRKERPYAKIVYTSPRRSISTTIKNVGATRVGPLVTKTFRNVERMQLICWRNQTRTMLPRERASTLAHDGAHVCGSVSHVHVLTESSDLDMPILRRTRLFGVLTLS